jgi:hypothetical protein
MAKSPLKITKLYFDLTDPSSYVETFEVMPKLIGRGLTPDETYQRYLKMLKGKETETKKIKTEE